MGWRINSIDLSFINTVNLLDLIYLIRLQNFGFKGEEGSSEPVGQIYSTHLQKFKPKVLFSGIELEQQRAAMQSWGKCTCFKKLKSGHTKPSFCF